VHIAGSTFPNVHPNTWQPLTSREQMVTATQTVHQGGAFASRIVLPVIPR
jgi:predicted acyl esterase